MTEKAVELIAGGGIGGLALALMLHQQGADCAVYEAAAELMAAVIARSACDEATQSRAPDCVTRGSGLPRCRGAARNDEEGGGA